MTVVRIIGIGSPSGDDRIGWETIDALRASGLPAHFPAGSISTECCDRPGARLVALLADADPGIVIDAMRSGAPPGTIRRLTAGEVEAAPGLLSSHGFGLAEALALARALGALPPRLIVFGVELAQAHPGAGLSAPVRAAIPGVLERIIGELAAVGPALAAPVAGAHAVASGASR